jgi:hypothetical protein
MPKPIQVTLIKLEEDYALCRDADGHEFYFPRDLLPEQEEGAVVCFKITHENESENTLEAKTILNTILSEKIA